MSVLIKEMERNHGHWKRYGWACTCSECGFVTEGKPKYCRKCGSIMDEPEEWSPPTIILPILNFVPCPSCGVQIIVNDATHYCEECGAKLDES